MTEQKAVSKKLQKQIEDLLSGEKKSKNKIVNFLLDNIKTNNKHLEQIARKLQQVEQMKNNLVAVRIEYLDSLAEQLEKE